MPRNKIKQDFNFTTLKGFKIIKLTTCDRFYNKINPAPFTVFDSFSHLFLLCQYYLFTLRKYRVLSLVSN
jgi:hypothetical protein